MKYWFDLIPTTVIYFSTPVKLDRRKATESGTNQN